MTSLHKQVAPAEERQVQEVLDEEVQNAAFNLLIALSPVTTSSKEFSNLWDWYPPILTTLDHLLQRPSANTTYSGVIMWP